MRNLPILVAVEDSASARAALRWAAAEAALRETDIVALHAWREPIPPPPPLPPLMYGGEEIAAGARALLAEVVASALGPLREVVPVQEVVTAGDPAQVLAERSADAQLLVLGAPSHRVLSRILGSVGTALMTQARCPIVVVHAEERPSLGEVSP